MDTLYVAKQKIFTRNNKVFAYELLFRDNEFGIKNFPTNLKATSHVIVNVLMNVHEILDETNIVLVNIDEKFLLSGMIDILDKSKFMLEILETTELSEKVIARIKQYHKRGFKIAIDDFDCSAKMTQKFTPIFKYIHLVKIDVISSDEANLKKMVPKIKKLGLKILAEKVETQEEYQYYFDLGFDLFQGYHLHKPETVEVNRGRDLTQFVILNIIKLMKNNADTKEIEAYIKQRSDLSLKLIDFLNSHGNLNTKIESIIQAMTLLGRDKLLRWLLLYLYSEMSDNPISEMVLAIGLKRAEIMEKKAEPKEKDKAYLAGMFSMIGALFDTTNEEVVKGIKLDTDIMDLIVRKKGKYLSSLLEAEEQEQKYFKNACTENFNKINIVEILYLLEASDIEFDASRL